MSNTEKFSSKMSPHLLEHLRSYSEESGKPISRLLDEAVSIYLDRVRLRPEFLKAESEIIAENSELLSKLAK